MDKLKFKAFRQTVGFCAIVAIISTAIVYLASMLSAQVIAWICIIGLFALGFYVMYNFNLSRLQLEEKYPSNEK